MARGSKHIHSTVEMSKAWDMYSIGWLEYLEKEQRELIKASSGISLFAKGVTDCPKCNIRVDWCSCPPIVTRNRLIEEYFDKKTDHWVRAEFYQWKEVAGNQWRGATPRH